MRQGITGIADTQGQSIHRRPARIRAEGPPFLPDRRLQRRSPGQAPTAPPSLPDGDPYDKRRPRLAREPGGWLACHASTPGGGRAVPARTLDRRTVLTTLRRYARG